jgi:hypothetical protein
MCEIDITYFPFDDQTCALVFGAWSYHTTKMNLTNSSDSVNLDSYERNGEWEVITTRVRGVLGSVSLTHLHQGPISLKLRTSFSVNP